MASPSTLDDPGLRPARAGIRSAIATGRLAIGDQLPTVRQLAVSLRVNANTVAKVYAFLERDGVLETRRGVGTFIAARTMRRATKRRSGAIELNRLVDRFLADLSITSGSRVEDARPVFDRARAVTAPSKEHEPWHVITMPLGRTHEDDGRPGRPVRSRGPTSSPFLMLIVIGRERPRVRRRCSSNRPGRSLAGVALASRPDARAEGRQAVGARRRAAAGPVHRAARSGPLLDRAVCGLGDEMDRSARRSPRASRPSRR